MSAPPLQAFVCIISNFVFKADVCQNIPQISGFYPVHPWCAVKRRGTSVGESPTRQMLLQSVATGAETQVTTSPKPPV